MADTLLDIDQACKILQLSREQVVALVKQGVLRAFRDQKTYKFRRADVAAYRKQAESSATVIFDQASKDEEGSDTDMGAPKSDTSKIDLADIEAEPGADESDQTSVMKPAQEPEKEGKDEESPVFEFSEDDLGLALDAEPVSEEADQTSLMAPVDKGAGAEEEEQSPVFEFTEKEEKGSDMALEEAPADSVLVADESESSLDILEVAEESSSDTESSQSELALADEPTSGEDVIAVEEVEESSDVGIPAAEAGAKQQVSDLLGGPEEGSEELLETVELDELAEPTESEEAAVQLAEAAPEAEQPPTAETVPLAEEAETVGLPEEDATQVVAEPEAVEAEVPEGLAEGMEAALEEEAEVEAAARAMVAPGWDIVVPSAIGNGFLMAALVLLAVGGWFMLCEIGGLDNPIKAQLIEIVGQYF